jgi:transcriptional regulator with XRE-family HTH domain
MPPQKSLPELLAARRRARGLSAQNAARELRVSKQAYYAWEQGSSRPRKGYFHNLMAFLGLDRQAFERAYKARVANRPNDPLAKAVSSASHRVRKIVAAVIAADALDDEGD